MLSALFCSLALAAAPPQWIATALDAPPSREELRAAYRDLMRLTAPGRNPDPGDVVPPLIALHRAIGRAEDVAFQERRRLRSGLEARLVPLRARLIRDVNRRTARGPQGGGANGQARQLIALITTTIEPDSWAATGGQGTIGYYTIPQPVLVVRQTGEVHHQIGALLGALGR